MEREPAEPTTDETQPPEETPPPFEPDPRLFAHLERGGKPGAEEIQRMVERTEREHR